MDRVIPKKSTSGRKQWSLQDGPRSSLKLLRNQLASDGCPESQVILAKQLLESGQQYQSISEKKENERLAVYWLIKASQQGNKEATELLKNCLKTGKGISEHNFLDVKSCITMTQDEKLTRKAAKEIFASLSNGSDYITTDQLQKKIIAIDKNKGVKPDEPSESLENGELPNGELARNEEESSDSDTDTDWTLRSDSSCSSEKLTEDHLISAAIDYSQGQLPLMNKSLCLTTPNLQVLNNIPYVYRSILHPWLVLKIFYYKMLKLLGKQVNSLYMKSEVRMIIVLCVYTFFNCDNYLYVFPTLLYYVTFIFMVLTTCQMLQNQRNFLDFRLWSGLFLCYSGGSLNAEEAEQQYIKNNLKPYGHFFLALLVNLLVYSFISEQWVPDSELAVISFCLTFITLIGFMPKNRSKIYFDFTILLSFAVNVLAKYPYETDPVVTQGWRFLDLKIPMFASYVVGNGIEFCLNFRLVIYATIPIVFLQIAAKQNWRGTYQILIPHCVTLSWLQICIISSQGATMYGLLRGVLALVGVVMFLPFVGLTSVLLPAVALTKWLIASNMTYTVCFFVAVTSVALVVSWFLAHTRFRKYTAIIQVIMMLTAFVALINMTNYDDPKFTEQHKEPKYLSWEAFQRFCHQPVWQDENVALAQLNCAELEDSLVHWDGYINNIKVKSITNFHKKIFKKLPRTVYQYLSCYFGDEISYLPCDNALKYVPECQTFKKIKNKCSLEKFNKYTFEMTITMNSGIWGKSPEVTLDLDNYFRNFTLKLKPGDHVWFKGKLFNNEQVGSDGILGGFKPHILIEELGCHTCQNNGLSEISVSNDSILCVSKIVQYISNSFKFIFNVLLNPVVIFK